MKNHLPISLILILTILSQDVANCRAATNIRSGEMRSVRATPIEQLAIEKAVNVARAQTIWTNGVPFDNAQPQVGTTSQEIRLTELGCEATWGRHKAFFEADLAS